VSFLTEIKLKIITIPALFTTPWKCIADVPELPTFFSHWTGGCAGLRSDLRAEVAKRNFTKSCRPSSLSLVTLTWVIKDLCYQSEGSLVISDIESMVAHQKFRRVAMYKLLKLGRNQLHGVKFAYLAKIFVFYKTLRFITVFTKTCQYTLSWSIYSQSTSTHPMYVRSIWMLSSHLLLCFRSVFLHSVISINILDAFLICLFVLHILPSYHSWF
jgi:hypothetical protein